MLNIHLYLGAHKTATTHLQGILLASRALLAERDIRLSAPQDVRKEWLPKFFKYCHNPERRQEPELLAELKSIAPASGLWILTEENIAGVSNDFAVKPGMYPAMAERIACLMEIFKDAKFSLFFSVRSYDSFYRSAYSEVVRNRGYLPFSEFYDASRFESNSWLDLVRKLERVLPARQIHLWQFENFRPLVPRLLQAMTGLENPEALMKSYKAETTRPSLSQKTMDLLEQLHPVLDRKESLALVERINRAYPVSDDYPAYKPYTATQEARFRQQYDRDLSMIKTGFPEICFLEP